VKKLKLAVKYGADTVMDLSTGGVNLDEVRTAIIGWWLRCSMACKPAERVFEQRLLAFKHH